MAAAAELPCLKRRSSCTASAALDAPPPTSRWIFGTRAASAFHVTTTTFHGPNSAVQIRRHEPWSRHLHALPREEPWRVVRRLDPDRQALLRARRSRGRPPARLHARLGPRTIQTLREQHTRGAHVGRAEHDHELRRQHVSLPVAPSACRKPGQPYMHERVLCPRTTADIGRSRTPTPPDVNQPRPVARVHEPARWMIDGRAFAHVSWSSNTPSHEVAVFRPLCVIQKRAAYYASELDDESRASPTLILIGSLEETQRGLVTGVSSRSTRFHY
ncbi:hypothetical protein B0H10DRAFT_2196272 [Mycena sp. CBHHK59/15]|nr:hypothetical protein B0H10DRAFT_2196272 [Mycena sp. CBHHK59/15]